MSTSKEYVGVCPDASPPPFRCRSILIMAGGTGGHIFPALAVADILRGQGWQVTWLGAPDSMEADLVPKHGYEMARVRFSGLRGKGLLRKLMLPLNLVVALWQSAVAIFSRRPDVVLGMGGYITFPGGLMSVLLRRPLVIHEQNSVAGLTNRVLSRFAKRVLAAFPSAFGDRATLVGNPVRPEIFAGEANRAERHLGLDAGLPALLVMGGSQGAEKVNELIFSLVPELINFCQIVHIVGKGNMVEWADRAQFGEAAKRYHAIEYAHELLPDIYARVDLVVCRAGLSTLTELAAIGKPTIVIPIPHHQQEANAEYFNRKNAIVYFEQEKSSAGELREIIEAMLKNPSSLSRLSEYMKKVMPAAANERYVKLVREICASKS